MKLLPLFFSLGLFFHSGITVAQSNNTLIVVGRQSCGSWVKYHAENDNFGRTVLRNWVMGYLSGVAMTTGKDFLRGLDGPSAFLWVDQYCQKNPLKNLVDASEQLVVELSKK